MENQTPSQHKGLKAGLVIAILLLLLAAGAYAGFILYQAGPNDEMELVTPITNTSNNTNIVTINTNTATDTNSSTTDSNTTTTDTTTSDSTEDGVEFTTPSDLIQDELINGLIPKSGRWLLTHEESDANLYGSDCAGTYNVGSGVGTITFADAGDLAVWDMDDQSLVFYGGTSNNTYVYVTDHLTFPVQTEQGVADGIAQLEMNAQTEEYITGFIRWDNRVGCEGEYPMELTLVEALPSELINITYGNWELDFPDYNPEVDGEQNISFLENELLISINLADIPDFISGACTLSSTTEGIICETAAATVALTPIGDNAFASSDTTWSTVDGISITGHFTIVVTSSTEMMGYFNGVATTPSGLEVDFGVPFAFTLQ